MQLDVFTLVPHAYSWLTEQRPLATVVIGGILLSTLLTLFVLPGALRIALRPVSE